MKLFALTDGVCAVCRVAPNKHERCAICEGSNQLVRLCRRCRRENAAWNAKRLDGAAMGDDDELDDDVGPRPTKTIARPVRDVQAPTRGRGRPRSARIDDAVIPQLLERERRVREVVRRIDLEGRFRGTYVRWRWCIPSRREIARNAGCSQHAVDRRHRDYAGERRRNSRASSARALTK